MFEATLMQSQIRRVRCPGTEPYENLPGLESWPLLLASSIEVGEQCLRQGPSADHGQVTLLGTCCLPIDGQPVTAMVRRPPKGPMAATDFGPALRKMHHMRSCDWASVRVDAKGCSTRLHGTCCSDRRQVTCHTVHRQKTS